MKVSYAHLQENTEVPGLINDSRLTQTKFPGIEMTLRGSVMEVEYKGRLVLVPLTNVRALEIAKRENHASDAAEAPVKRGPGRPPKDA